MKNKKVTEINGLSFGQARHGLWSQACENFISEQPERFVLMEGKKCLKGTVYFCNTYLEAIFTMKLFNGVGLYSDEYDGNWVVASKNRYE